MAYEMVDVFGSDRLPTWGWYADVSERRALSRPSASVLPAPVCDGDYTHSLVFLFAPDGIVLGLKRRGFGAGTYNGLGGKVQGESAHHCALRECKEEANLSPSHLSFRGRIDITVDKGERISIALFTAQLTEAEAAKMRTSDEMEPQIFPLDRESDEWKQVNMRPEAQIYFSVLLYLQQLHAQEDATMLTLHVHFEAEPKSEELANTNQRPENRRTLHTWSLALHRSITRPP